jgi:hypothetical protein
MIIPLHFPKKELCPRNYIIFIRNMLGIFLILCNSKNHIILNLRDALEHQLKQEGYVHG